MATQVAHVAPVELLPLYRMGDGTYEQLVAAGALEGLDVELHDGVIVDREPDGTGPVHLFDVDTYNRMVRTGALEDEKLELLEGRLVAVMSRQSWEHATAIMWLTRYLSVAKEWLMVQLPLELKPDSEPEPDLALAEGKQPRGHHRQTALLAVEVSMTSHYKDRQVKAPRYAKSGISMYWLVDIPGRVVEVYTDPGPDGYGHCEIYGLGDVVPAPVQGVPDLAVDSLFAEFDD
jgi:Uma2 family endonuclease